MEYFGCYVFSRAESCQITSQPEAEAEAVRREPEGAGQLVKPRCAHLTQKALATSLTETPQDMTFLPPALFCQTLCKHGARPADTSGARGHGDTGTGERCAAEQHSIY